MTTLRECHGRGGPCDDCTPEGRRQQVMEYNESERQRTVVRRARWQWVWWIGAWALPLLALGGLLALWMLRRARVKYADPAPWLQDAKPMLYAYIIPLIVTSTLIGVLHA